MIPLVLCKPKRVIILFTRGELKTQYIKIPLMLCILNTVTALYTTSEFKTVMIPLVLCKTNRGTTVQHVHRIPPQVRQKA